MKATRKLVPAVVMLLVSAVLLSTASYAWFVSSATVKGTGMNVTATVPTSLTIRATEADSWVFESAMYDENSTVAKLFPITTNGDLSVWYTADGTGTTNYAQNGAATEIADIKAVTADPKYPDVGYAKVYTCQVTSTSNLDDFCVQSFQVSLSGTNFGKTLRVGVNVTDGTNVANWIFDLSDTDEATTIATLTGVDPATGYTTTLSGTETNYNLAAGTVYDVTVYIWFEGNDEECNTNEFVNYVINGATDTVNITFGEGPHT